MQDTRCRIQDAGYRMQDAGCRMQTPWARFRLGLRCSVSGPRPWRDKGRGRCDLPTCFVQAEGREPKAEHRIQCPVPPLGPRYPAFGVGSTPVPGIRSQVPGPGTWYLVPNTKGKAGIPARFPVYVPKNAHTGFASYILHPVSCILHTPCAGFSKTGGWCQVRAPGTWDPDRINAEGRIPSTEDRVGNAHTGFASYILHPVSCILHPVI